MESRSVRSQPELVQISETVRRQNSKGGAAARPSTPFHIFTSDGDRIAWIRGQRLSKVSFICLHELTDPFGWTASVRQMTLDLPLTAQSHEVGLGPQNCFHSGTHWPIVGLGSSMTGRPLLLYAYSRTESEARQLQ